MAADGSIIIKTEVDNKKAQSELKKLESQIDKLNQKISGKQQTMSPLVEQSKQLGAALDEANRKLYNMQNNTDFYYTTAQVKEQEKTVKTMTAEYNKLNDQIDKMGNSVKADTAKLEEMQSKAGELAGQLAGAGKSTKGMSEAAEAAQQRIGKMSKHIATLARRVLVFSLISAALRKIKNYMWEAIQTNDEAMAAVARLKGALMTLAQPIINVVIPAFMLMVNVITRIVNAISRLVSLLFGTTIQKSAQGAKALNDQKKGIEGVGKAAKEASKYLAGFDELNVMDDQSGTDGSGGSGLDAGGGIAPDFTGQISDSLSTIVELFTGAALLGLGAILTFSGANIPLGIALMALGAIAIWDAVSENWDKIKEMLQGTALGMAAFITGLVLVVLGMMLAFSGVSIPVGLGLILAGAAVLAPAVAANWDALKPQIVQVCKELLGIGTILLLAIGLTLTLTCVNLPLGIGLLVLGAAGLAAVVAINWDSIVTALQGPIGKIAAIAGATLLVLGIILLFTGVGIPLGLGLMLAGGASLAAAIAPNWDFIKDKISGVWNNIKNWWNTNVAKFFTKEWWANLGRKVIDGLLSGLRNAWNTVVSWVQSAIDWISNAFSSVVNFFTGGGGTSAQGSFSSQSAVNMQAMPALRAVDVPALARGAVIPPNRKFMAVLGDQKSGTNIEAPLDTIKQAVAEVLGQGSDRPITIIVQMDGKEMFRQMVRENNSQVRMNGKSPLMV